MGVRRLFFQGREKIFQGGGGAITYFLLRKQWKWYYFSQKSLKAYSFWPALAGRGGKEPPCPPLRTPMIKFPDHNPIAGLNLRSATYQSFHLYFSTWSVRQMFFDVKLKNKFRIQKFWKNAKGNQISISYLSHKYELIWHQCDKMNWNKCNFKSWKIKKLRKTDAIL